MLLVVGCAVRIDRMSDLETAGLMRGSGLGHAQEMVDKGYIMKESVVETLGVV